MKCISLWHVIRYATGHVVTKAGHQNTGPKNNASFSPCSVSAVGCDIMQLSGGDTDSAWPSWHYVPETHRLSECISTTKQAMSLCLSYFSVHVSFPPIKGLNLHIKY